MEISEISSRISGDQPPWGGSFGALLKWHYDNGTRAKVTPGEQKKDWSPQEFGEAIRYDGRNLTEWFNKNRRPRNFDAIAGALFGNHLLHQQWKQVLKVAYDKLPVPGRRSASQRGVKDFIGVPAQLPEFVGRESDIDRLDEIFREPDSASYVGIIFGLGGIGKTSLAVEYAFRSVEEFEGIWWISATSRAEVQLNVIELARHLGVYKEQERENELAAILCVQAISRKAPAWLLIFDNVETPADVEGLIPSGQIRSVITTRFSNWGIDRQTVPMELLSPEHSVDLLNSIANRSDEIGALQLAEVLEWLPLALNQAAITCKITGLSFQAYAEQAEILLPEAPSKVNYPNSVYRTFQLAIEAAEVRSPGAKVLMYFLGHCSPEPVPTQLAISQRQRDRRSIGALTTLIEFSLAQRADFEDGAAAVRVHRLVQCVARDRAEQETERTNILQQLVEALTQYFPSRERMNSSAESLLSCRRLFPHLIALQARVRECDYLRDLDYLFDTGALYAGAKGRFREAELLARAAVNLAGQRRGGEKASILFNENLAKILSLNYSLEEAIVTFVNLKKLIEADFPVSKSRLFSVHCGIALVLQKSGRIDEAIEEYRQAEAVIGAASPENRLEFLLAVATLKSDRQEFADALVMFEEALELVVDVNGKSSDLEADINALIADCQLGLGNPHYAALSLTKTLQLQARNHRSDHPKVYQTMARLGLIASYVSSRNDWEPYFVNAIDGLSRQGGTEVPLATCLNTYGNALDHKQRKTEVLAKYLSALEALEPLFDDTHEVAVAALFNIALSYLRLNRPEDACIYAKRAAFGYDLLYGPTHKLAMRACLQYAGALEAIGQYKDAAKFIGDHRARCEQHMCKDDPQLAELDGLQHALHEKERDSEN